MDPRTWPLSVAATQRLLDLRADRRTVSSETALLTLTAKELVLRGTIHTNDVVRKRRSSKMIVSTRPAKGALPKAPALLLSRLEQAHRIDLTRLLRNAVKRHRNLRAEVVAAAREELTERGLVTQSERRVLGIFPQRYDTLTPSGEAWQRAAAAIVDRGEQLAMRSRDAAIPPAEVDALGPLLVLVTGGLAMGARASAAARVAAAGAASSGASSAGTGNAAGSAGTGNAAGSAGTGNAAGSAGAGNAAGGLDAAGRAGALGVVGAAGAAGGTALGAAEAFGDDAFAEAEAPQPSSTQRLRATAGTTGSTPLLPYAGDGYGGEPPLDNYGDGAEPFSALDGLGDAFSHLLDDALSSLDAGLDATFDSLDSAFDAIDGAIGSLDSAMDSGFSDGGGGSGGGGDGGGGGGGD